ncbi:aminoglycoside phosphotransferase family protein [Saccharospirillum mangrovi]|uniref:aminoglycoside phosphotransferase family protein n=1 Tax=Saccharospirillum mangrovi TaxID=2161747 RepID=UPI000D33EA9A|nr:aminoglycoside phosphotransferase family protein [Saccharospirillum mangrovi]
MTTQSLTMTDLGQPLVSARSADIYAWQAGQIVKLFHAEYDQSMADLERRNAEEAHAKGATAIECLGMVNLDGRFGLVMNRIDGTTLTGSLDHNPLNFLSIPRRMAVQHARVHAAETDQLPDVKSQIHQHIDTAALDFLSDAQRARLHRYLDQLPDGNTLLHMDFHTENILVNPHLETVIDWATAARGHVGADLAMTHFLFHEAELFPGISKFKEWLYGRFRLNIYRRYFKHYARLRQLDPAWINQQIDAWMLPIRASRLALWQAPTEIEPLQQQIRAGIEALPA